MTTAFFEDLIWQKGDSAIEQGVKNMRTPNNAIAGGFGTFRVSIPAEVTLILKTNNGLRYFNIIRTIKAVTGRKKMSEKLINTIRNGMMNETFEINQYGGITNLREILEKTTF